MPVGKGRVFATGVTGAVREGPKGKEEITNLSIGPEREWRAKGKKESS